MFILSVEHTFSAAHAIVLRGIREPLHGHNWHVTLKVGAPSLDQDGLVCDFHDIERNLRNVTDRFHNRNINDIPPFDQSNPTAENIAHHIGTAIAGTLPEGVHLISCAVTEAPGCTAIYQHTDV